MKTILTSTESSLRELGSKFHGFLFHCANETEFKGTLEIVKKDFPDASHHCYGYRIDPSSVIEFSSDDGEPSGTAGLPILNQLKSFEVINSGIVVVRYFGGTKLGKAGLIQSYGDTAKLCLEKASLQEIQLVQLFEIIYPYSLENVINKLITNYHLNEQSAEYLENVTKVLACEIKRSSQFEKELKSLYYLDVEYIIKESTHISI